MCFFIYAEAILLEHSTDSIDSFESLTFPKDGRIIGQYPSYTVTGNVCGCDLAPFKKEIILEMANQSCLKRLDVTFNSDGERPNFNDLPSLRMSLEKFEQLDEIEENLVYKITDYSKFQF